MGKAIFNKNLNDSQLIIIGIELAHAVLGLTDCNPDLLNISHLAKAKELAEKWNDRFITTYVGKEPK